MIRVVCGCSFIDRPPPSPLDHDPHQPPPRNTHINTVGKDAYRDDFEAPLLEATKSYYALTAQAWLATDDTPAYLLKARRVYACICMYM